MQIKRRTSEATDWHAVWRLLKPYWVSEEKWKARGLLATVVVLALGMVYINVLFNEWNRVFYNALESKDLATFKQQLLAVFLPGFHLYCGGDLQGLPDPGAGNPLAGLDDAAVHGWLAFASGILPD